jgi:putative membrane protein
VNTQAELAKERNRAAAERTLMAWIRTCLSLISFGFGIDVIVRTIQERSQADINTFRFSGVLGLAFIGLGTYAIIVAADAHAKELKYLTRSEGYLYRERRSLALTVALCLVCIGVLAFLGIVFKLP